jgi:hypothetical protein
MSVAPVVQSYATSDGWKPGMPFSRRIKASRSSVFGPPPGGGGTRSSPSECADAYSVAVVPPSETTSTSPPTTPFAAAEPEFGIPVSGSTNDESSE